jgi:hypothetical protein
MIHHGRRSGLVAGCFLLIGTTLTAQRPQTREGFWISFGFGAGNLSWECDGCTKQDHGGRTGFLRLGGTPSNKILLGAEINAWALDIGPADIIAGYTAFTVYWYPSATGGLFLKGGLGSGYYERQSASSRAESTSGAILLGAGYDIRVGRKISISPMLTLWSSSKADLKDNGATLDTGFRHSGGTLQLGITFH